MRGRGRPLGGGRLCFVWTNHVTNTYTHRILEIHIDRQLEIELLDVLYINDALICSFHEVWIFIVNEI